MSSKAHSYCRPQLQLQHCYQRRLSLPANGGPAPQWSRVGNVTGISRLNELHDRYCKADADGRKEAATKPEDRRGFSQR